MANTRTITCDCGTPLEEKETNIDHILTKAMVCPRCRFTTLTKEQAQLFRQRVEFHKAIDQEKQVIKIGNSMGVILPDALQDFGIKVGTKVRIEAIDQRSFRVEAA